MLKIGALKRIFSICGNQYLVEFSLRVKNNEFLTVIIFYFHPTIQESNHPFRNSDCQ